MNPESIGTVLGNPVARAIGWSLVHFVWLGALIGAAAAATLTMLRGARSEVRYLAACLALVLMALAPVATTIVTLRSQADTSAGLTIADVRAAPGTAPGVGHALPAALRERADLAAEPAAASSAATPIAAWIPAILAVWMAGVSLLSLRLVAGWTLLHRRLRHEQLPAPAHWQRRLTRIAGRMHLARPVRLLESARAAVPCSVGWLRPIVFLPASTLTGLAPHQLEAILAHELAHVRRHDYIVNLLQSVVETLLFYHPAVWWVSHRVRVEREYCCDDCAVAACGDSLGYARALADLEHLRRPRASLALAATDGSLLARVRRILGAPDAYRGKGPQWEVAAVVLLLLGGLAIGANALGLQAPLVPPALRSAQGLPAAPEPPQTPTAPTGPPSMVEPPEPPAIPEAPSVPDAPDLVPVTQAPPAPPAPPTPPAPPVPPAPPAPPVPSAPPAVPDSFFGRLGAWFHGAISFSDIFFSSRGPERQIWYDDNGRTVIHWVEHGHGVGVRSSGTITFTEDDTDVKSVSPGGYFILSEHNGGTTTYEVRARADGSLERLWNGKPAGAEAKAWLARVMPEFLRRTGFNADARVSRILAQKGASGVLDEISVISSSYVKRVYFEKLFAKGPLDPATFARAIRQAGAEMTSDYERASTLVAAAKLGLPDEACRIAFAEATRTMKSDYEKHRTLSALIAAGPITPQVASAVVESARSMQSDYELAGLLVQVVKTQSLPPAAADLALTLADSIKSDYERHRALSALVKGRTLDDATLTRLLTSASRMTSDYELSNLLQELLKGQRLSAPAADALFKAVGTIDSDYERSRVLRAAMASPSAALDLRPRVIQSVAGMKSDYERANVLVAAAKGGALDAATRKAYVDAARSIKSEYERNRALAALADTQG
jgi:beta-lactamase regulating signal transducer with metallopeptidase domain